MHRQFLPKSFDWDTHSQEDIDNLHDLINRQIWQVPSFEDLSHESLAKYIENVIGLTNGDKNTKKDRGYLLLNYHWQKHMGDLTFNTKAFPNINATMKLIK